MRWFFWRMRFCLLFSLKNKKRTLIPDRKLQTLGVAAVGMGQRYADWCCTMITSLREAGDFDGPVYVITDKPDLFAHFSNVQIIHVPSSRHRLIAKQCKPWAINMVTQRDGLYLDSDLVITSPVRQWIDDVVPKTRDYSLLCFPDSKPCPGAFHGGVVYINTERARPLVKRWGQAIGTGRWGSDQACLYSVSDDDGPSHMPARGFIFLRTLMRYEHWDVPCIVHVGNGLMRDLSKDVLYAYMRDKLHVTRMPAVSD